DSPARGVARVAARSVQVSAARIEVGPLPAEAEQAGEPEAAVEPLEGPLRRFGRHGSLDGLERDGLGPGLALAERDRLLEARVAVALDDDDVRAGRHIAGEAALALGHAVHVHEALAVVRSHLQVCRGGR